jgi:radical SAM superfamily enzyme YgiQ (UPF0313 family)
MLAKPKLTLVNPRSPLAMWYPIGFTTLFDRAFCTNLALPSLAALVPEDYTVEVWDENRHPVVDHEAPEIVAITGYSTQADRMIELGDLYRSKGSLVCMGGIHATCATDEVRDHADVIFLGEAERTWPRFLQDYLSGSHHKTYAEDGAIDLSETPPPDIRFMGPESYLLGLVQTSRGCPHDCEFCSVVEFLGHRVRCKPSDRTVIECEALYRSGFRNIFLTDDNFFAKRSHAQSTLDSLASWNEGNDEGTDFIMQSSVDIAQDTSLLEQLVRAGVKTLFVGIESIDPESLKETGKRPNLDRDLASDLRAMARQGLWVYPGLIIGFDHDTTSSFDRTFEFVQSSSSLMPMILPLMAAPGTKLEARLKAEGRWRGRAAEYALSDSLSTNITPSGMAYDELLQGYLALLKRVYAPESFLERLSLLESLWSGGVQSSIISTPPKDLLGLISETFSALARFGPGYRRAVKESFRVAMRHPAHSHNIYLSLMFWRHVLFLTKRWEDTKSSFASSSHLVSHA